MTKLMLEAIEALRQLPSAQQDEVARAVLRLTGRDNSYQHASQNAETHEADTDIAYGDLVSVEDIRRSIEESRMRASTSLADEVFDRLETRLKASASRE